MNTSLSSISPSLSATSQLSTGSLEASSPAHSLDGNQSAWIASWTKNGFVSSSEALGSFEEIILIFDSDSEFTFPSFLSSILLYQVCPRWLEMKFC